MPKKVRVFGKARVRDRHHAFLTLRNKLTRKVSNPQLTQITFHTSALERNKEYHKTKVVMHVKCVLGHKNIQSTMIYVNLERAMFAMENDEFNVKVAGNLEGTCKLLAVGCEYVTDMDGKKLFRRQKGKQHDYG